MVCVISLFTRSRRVSKKKKKKDSSPRPLFFISPINRCKKFRQAINESEMRLCVLLILTVILPPGINVSPVVTDPDNSVELKKTRGLRPLRGNKRH